MNYNETATRLGLILAAGKNPANGKDTILVQFRTLLVTDPKTTALDGIECANPHFQTQLSGRQPGVFRLTIRPADTRQPDEAMVHLNAIVGGRAQTYVIYAAVK